MQLISKFRNWIRFYYALIVFSINTHELSLWKLENVITITNAFQKILDESNRKPNKIWVHKASEVYDRSMKSGLKNNIIEMYSMHNEGKFLVAERFIIALKNETDKKCAIDKFDDIVNKYNNTYYRTIKMEHFDVKSSIYII